jgi:hypothetical protein
MRHSALHALIPGQPEGAEPTAVAGLQTRTLQAARSASAMDGANQSVSAAPKPIPGSGLRLALE